MYKIKLQKLFKSVEWKSAEYPNRFITYLLVNHNYQNKGLGKIMMSHFCKKYQGFGRKILTTETDTEQFYNKFGFNVEGIAMFNKDWEGDI